MTLEVVRSVAALRGKVRSWRQAGETTALVPTMGALHQGHLTLCEKAREKASRVVATLFVNPKQFDRPDDLARYPRDEEADRRLLEKAGVDLLFAPPVEEVYPTGYATSVAVQGLTDCLCGKARPGHFTGMATVVTKLLNMGQADFAFFGEKDFQQLLIVKRLAHDLDIPTQIIGVPTVREADGLALSSRNRRLAPTERAIAPLLHQELTGLAAALRQGLLAEPLIAAAKARLLSAGFRQIDYLELRSSQDLASLERAGEDARLFIAAWLGEVRLIDNLAV